MIVTVYHPSDYQIHPNPQNFPRAHTDKTASALAKTKTGQRATRYPSTATATPTPAPIPQNSNPEDQIGRQKGARGRDGARDSLAHLGGQEKARGRSSIPTGGGAEISRRPRRLRAPRRDRRRRRRRRQEKSRVVAVGAEADEEETGNPTTREAKIPLPAPHASAMGESPPSIFDRTVRNHPQLTMGFFLGPLGLQLGPFVCMWLKPTRRELCPRLVSSRRRRSSPTTRRHPSRRRSRSPATGGAAPGSLTRRGRTGVRRFPCRGSRRRYATLPLLVRFPPCSGDLFAVPDPPPLPCFDLALRGLTFCYLD